MLPTQPEVVLERYQLSPNATVVDDFTLKCQVPPVDDDNVVYTFEWVVDDVVVDQREMIGEDLRNMSVLEHDFNKTLLHGPPIEQVNYH